MLERRLCHAREFYTVNASPALWWKTCNRWRKWGVPFLPHNSPLHFPEDLDGRGDLSNVSWSLSMFLAASPSVVSLLTRLEALTSDQLFTTPCGGRKSGS